VGMQVHDAAGEKSMTIPIDEFVQVYTQSLNNDVDMRIKPGAAIPPEDVDIIIMGDLGIPSYIGYSSGLTFDPAGDLIPSTLNGEPVDSLYSIRSLGQVFVNFIGAPAWTSINLTIDQTTRTLSFNGAGSFLIADFTLASKFVEGQQHPISMTADYDLVNMILPDALSGTERGVNVGFIGDVNPDSVGGHDIVSIASTNGVDDLIIILADSAPEFSSLHVRINSIDSFLINQGGGVFSAPPSQASAAELVSGEISLFTIVGLA